jgi:hypothetical protein
MNDSTEARPLTDANEQSPIALAHPSLFVRREIELYEALLADPSINERDASDFFSRFPKFLWIGGGAEVRREVVLLRDDGSSPYRVDFFASSEKSVGHRYAPMGAGNSSCAAREPRFGMRGFSFFPFVASWLSNQFPLSGKRYAVTEALRYSSDLSRSNLRSASRGDSVCAGLFVS